MFGAATNTNKFGIATGGQILACGEHVTGGLVGGGPQPSRCSRPLHQVASLHQVSAKCTHAHDVGTLNVF